MFGQSGSINKLFTFIFTQSVSITMFLTDLCSYLHLSKFLVVIILRQICR
jgi:hypothetical protein